MRALALGAAQLGARCEDEKLGKDEAFASTLRFVRSLRRMDGTVRVAQVRICGLGADVIGKRIGAGFVEQTRQILVHDRGDLAGREILTRAVNRDHFSVVDIAVAQQRILPDVDHCACERSLHATAHEEPHPFLKSTVDVAITSDPFCGKLARVVAQTGLDDLEAAYAALLDRRHGADGIFLTTGRAQCGRRRGIAQILVAKGQVVEQIA